ncbi:cytochrome P450 [Artemisia annua]|uniref:Cytochrome P450 n=1 Tax=Artemisia annua TaxID=35608 RepID=A0A2U1M1L7_ARTAN|nr:cytochrome P450 [Artemisia annua]
MTVLPEADSSPLPSKVNDQKLQPLLSRKTENISQYFNMPIDRAAKQLKVGLTVLKKQCRDLGIQRWPYRKIISLEKLINDCQEQVELYEENGNKQQIIAQLEAELLQLQQNPDLPIANTTKTLRQRNFKAKYKQKKTINLELTLSLSEQAHLSHPNDQDKPLQLWEENWTFLSEDILHHKRKVFRNGRSLKDFPDLPQPNPTLLTNLDNRLIREALDFDSKQSKIEHDQLHSLLNPEQRFIYEQEVVTYSKGINYLIRKELTNIHPPNVTFDELKTLDYLHATLSDSIRLFPPVPINSRLTINDDVLPDVTFFAYAMGRMERLWGSDCREFKPERWLDDNGVYQPSDQFKYPVFHGGFSMYLGKEMAYLQMKYLEVAIMYKFEVEVIGGSGTVEKMVNPPYSFSSFKYEKWVTCKVKEEITSLIRWRLISEE